VLERVSSRLNVQALNGSTVLLGVLNWERYWSKERYLHFGRLSRMLVSLASLFFAISRYGLLVIPSAITIVTAVLIYTSNFAIPPESDVDLLNLVLFVFTSLSFIGSIFAGMYVSQMYRRIVPTMSDKRQSARH
jgi:hypothetical protein